MITIHSTRIAYTIGFSSALHPDTISGYQELGKYQFPVDDTRKEKRLMKSFCRGYADGVKILKEVKRENAK